ncbi:hypothetical protein L6164_028810 [Bauhinia variegata]|uniref:Uncharacterized protein n=1 Tax=Bauhinia variegata TaxID=167791 RepID=A0ACB9L7B0_BAUVA|nr:hypothetical protein L6164_028810 [Bauhinia variegata]
MSKSFLFALLIGLALAVLNQAQDQSGFISIDCGLLPTNIHYTEENTNINYISDARFISSVQITNAYRATTFEIIHIPALDYVQICLVNTYSGTPFISAIELRPLNNNAYVTDSESLALWMRVDLGSTKAFRYNYDVYDRFWYSDVDVGENDRTSLNVPIRAGSLRTNKFQPPEIVMSTLITPANASTTLCFSWTSTNANNKYYVYLHFAELRVLAKNETRAFNIILNGQVQYGNLVPQYLSVVTYFTRSAISGERFEYCLVRTENSTLPPILNAIEIYTVKELPQLETDQEDYEAITSIQSTYGLTKNWQGDPCSPIEYLWDGLNCTNDGYKTWRITTLKLSSSGLTGEIDPSISKLTMLEKLDLSNNSLNGEVPDFLSQLELLTSLNLDNNNLTGPVPAELIEKSRIDMTTERDPKDTLMKIQKRQYSYSDVINITNNFDKIIGKGGFGTVYLGFIDDIRVAVKMLSPSSAQGYQQFQAEVKLLMTVHHRNLTSLIGYCNEETNKGLIYEYMANGNLNEHLSGKHSKSKFLTWEDRLRISIDAAQGLEYLHNGCKPPITHRDIKSTNILLNEHFQAKISDFGLSKTMVTTLGGTQLSSLLGGTPGYMDPEFYITNRIIDKSDVYSFGVVLLELITNQQPVIERNNEMIHISQWVSSMVANGDIKQIVYSRLQGEFNSNSAWKAVEIAMACVSPNSKRRPSMSEVVIELKESLATALPPTSQSGVSATGSQEEVIMNLSVDSTPLAR